MSEIELEDLERLREGDNPTIEARLLSSLVKRKVKRNSNRLLLILSALLFISLIFNIYQYLKLSVCSATIGNINILKDTFVPITGPTTEKTPSEKTAVARPKSVFAEASEREHGCNYINCDLDVVNYHKLKIYRTCKQCFKDLKPLRVFKEYHGSDYGIEFEFKSGQHIQNWTKYDWMLFNNITSKLNGEYRLIIYNERNGEDDKYVIQWFNLNVPPEPAEH